MIIEAQWAGYAAAIWAALFALISLYWAAGGTAGADTIRDAIAGPALAREAGIVAFLWATVFLKALAVVLALASVQPWGKAFPRLLLIAAGWTAALIMILWGGALWIQRGLVEAGVVEMPRSMDATAIRWHLALWDPFWLVGGLLFLGATRYFQTHSGATRQTTTGSFDQMNSATFVTSLGSFKVGLMPDHAPNTVANFVELASGRREWRDPRDGKRKSDPLYDGTIFHRVIPNFMIQGGDPEGTGRGGPGYRFEDEVPPGGPRFDRPGLLAMANSGPNTNGSQFFITVAPTPWLNGKHTIFGEVTEGMEVVQAISTAETDRNDKPVTDVRLERVEIEDES